MIKDVLHNVSNRDTEVDREIETAVSAVLEDFKIDRNVRSHRHKRKVSVRRHHRE